MKRNEYFFAKQEGKPTNHNVDTCSTLQTKCHFKAKNQITFESQMSRASLLISKCRWPDYHYWKKIIMQMSDYYYSLYLCKKNCGGISNEAISSFQKVTWQYTHLILYLFISTLLCRHFIAQNLHIRSPIQTIVTFYKAHFYKW